MDLGDILRRELDHLLDIGMAPADAGLRTNGFQRAIQEVAIAEDQCLAPLQSGRCGRAPWSLGRKDAGALRREREQRADKSEIVSVSSA